MNNPTEEMKAMARLIAEGLFAGDAFRSAAYQAALVAIIETQRKDAELAEGVNGSQRVPNWPLDGKEIATAIRSGKHYGKADQ